MPTEVVLPPVVAAPLELARWLFLEHRERHRQPAEKSRKPERRRETPRQNPMVARRGA